MHGTYPPPDLVDLREWCAKAEDWAKHFCDLRWEAWMRLADRWEMVAELERLGGVFVPAGKIDVEHPRQELAQVERNVETGERRIERLRRIIADLERGGRHVAWSRQLLDTFTDTLALHAQTRQRLLRELGETAWTRVG